MASVGTVDQWLARVRDSVDEYVQLVRKNTQDIPLSFEMLVCLLYDASEVTDPIITRWTLAYALARDITEEAGP